MLKTKNTQEMVDIVDENNKVFYKTSKGKAHELGLLHRTITAEVIRHLLKKG